MAFFSSDQYLHVELPFRSKKMSFSAASPRLQTLSQTPGPCPLPYKECEILGKSWEGSGLQTEFRSKKKHRASIWLTGRQQEMQAQYKLWKLPGTHWRRLGAPKTPTLQFDLFFYGSRR